MPRPRLRKHRTARPKATHPRQAVRRRDLEDAWGPDAAQYMGGFAPRERDFNAASRYYLPVDFNALFPPERAEIQNTGAYRSGSALPYEGPNTDPRRDLDDWLRRSVTGEPWQDPDPPRLELEGTTAPAFGSRPRRGR